MKETLTATDVSQAVRDAHAHFTNRTRKLHEPGTPRNALTERVTIYLHCVLLVKSLVRNNPFKKQNAMSIFKHWASTLIGHDSGEWYIEGGYEILADEVRRLLEI